MLVYNALRLAADMPAKTTTHDLPQLARFLTRTLLARNASHTPARRALSRAYIAALSNNRRTYATTTRATGATKPTATVKKAVKAQAAKKPATKKPTTRKTTTAKKATAAKLKKKPAPKKKKAVAKKAAPKKRVKKVATPEEKAHASILALKKRALVEPATPGAVSALNAFVGELTRGEKGPGGSITAKLSDAAAKFKELTPADREHYNHLANERTIAKRKEYETWIHSFTPEQIRDANNARATLRRRLKGTKSRYLTHTAKLQDDRQVKRPVGPYTIFSTERMTSGDFKGIKIVDAAKLVGAEWKALSEGEKKKYQDSAAEAKARYEREMSAK